MHTWRSSIAGSMPQNGLVGKPGFGGLLSGPGRGVIVIPPVSECSDRGQTIKQ